MAKARTPESGVPLSTRLGRMVGVGRGKDIALPLQSGETRDPRTETPSLGRSLREAAKGFQSVRELTKGR